jgi:uncharacterized protein (TIGR03382 family)
MYNFDVTVTDSSSTPQTDMKTITLVIDPVSVTGSGGGGGDGGGCAATSGVPFAPAVMLLFLLVALRLRRAKKEQS